MDARLPTSSGSQGLSHPTSLGHQPRALTSSQPVPLAPSCSFQPRCVQSSERPGHRPHLPREQQNFQTLTQNRWPHRMTATLRAVSQ